MENYRLEGKTFVIDDYDRLPAFSSFIPGLAGVKGIPMWTFYTNIQLTQHLKIFR